MSVHTVTPITHALLSASSAPRWGKCPGSVALSAGIPDQAGGFARLGTALHEISNSCLEIGLPAAVFEGNTVKVESEEIEITPERVRLVQTAVDRANDFMAQPGALATLLETSLPIDHITAEPGAKSTLDFGVIWANEILAGDFKFGYNSVAAGTDQLVIYLDMLRRHAAEKFSVAPQKFTAVIIQPTATDGPKFDSVSYTADQLRERVQFLRVAAQSALNAHAKKTEPELNPGAVQCKYCRALAVCPAAKAHTEKTVRAMFPKLIPAPVELLTASDLDEIYPALDLIEDWAAAVRKEVFSMLAAGTPMANVKLVLGRPGNREWSDEKTAGYALGEILGDKTFKREIVSPAAAEKEAKKIGPAAVAAVAEFAAGNTTRTEAKPKVVPMSHKDPAIAAGVVFPTITTASL